MPPLSVSGTGGSHAGRIAVFAIVAAAIVAALAGLGFAAPNNPQTLAQRGAPAAIPVDAEVVLAVDVSYSMDPEEQALQREGYMAALTSREFLHGAEAGHARSHRADLFRMGRYAPSADHRAVAAH